MKQAIAFPLVVLVISGCSSSGYTFATTGSPLHLGIDFKGGTMVTLKTDKTDQALQNEFGAYPAETHHSRQRRREDAAVQRHVQGSADENWPPTSTATILAPRSSQIGSTFSAANQGQAVIAVIIAFIGMALTVFIIFRNPVPSAAVVMSAFADIVFAMAMMNLFGIELTFGTLAALLMLIGYSVDTDILLTTKVLGERKYIDKKIASCRATGLTMTGAAIVAFVGPVPGVHLRRGVRHVRHPGALEHIHRHDLRPARRPHQHLVLQRGTAEMVYGNPGCEGKIWLRRRASKACGPGFCSTTGSWP